MGFTFSMTTDEFNRVLKGAYLVIVKHLPNIALIHSMNFNLLSSFL